MNNSYDILDVVLLNESDLSRKEHLTVPTLCRDAKPSDFIVSYTNLRPILR